jgi:hypothetical protein
VLPPLGINSALLRRRCSLGKPSSFIVVANDLTQPIVFALWPFFVSGSSAHPLSSCEPESHGFFFFSHCLVERFFSSLRHPV